jgi:hypothetical protein
MAITHVNTNTATDGDGTTITVTKPSGTTTGDVLIAILTSNNQNGTAPAGFTEIADEVAGVFRCQMWYKVAGGSEPASYDLSVSNSTLLVGTVSAWRGCDTVSPIGITPVMDATDTGASEPLTTPSISGGSAGRVLYYRASRRATDTPITFTEASGSASERSDTGVGSGGGVAYSGALFSDDADFTGSGTKTGLAITANATETHNVVATWALQSLGNPAELDVSIPQIVVAIDGSPEIPAVLDVDVPLPTMDASIWNGTYNGPLEVVVPISVDIQAAAQPTGTLAASVLVEMTSEGETRYFSENVIPIEEDPRWLIVLQESIRLGSRRFARSEGILDVPVQIGMSFAVHADIMGLPASATAVASNALGGIGRKPGQAAVSATANSATVSIGQGGYPGQAAITATAFGASVAIGPSSGHASASVTAFRAEKGIPAGSVTSSVTAFGATIKITVSAGTSSSAATANSAAVSSVSAGAVSASAAANNATVSIKPNSGHVSVNCHN